MKLEIPCSVGRARDIGKQTIGQRRFIRRDKYDRNDKKNHQAKGLGFITPDDGTEDVFFHRGSLAPRAQIEDLNEGDSVQFQVRKGDKGPVALDVKIR